MGNISQPRRHLRIRGRLYWGPGICFAPPPFFETKRCRDLSPLFAPQNRLKGIAIQMHHHTWAAVFQDKWRRSYAIWYRGIKASWQRTPPGKKERTHENNSLPESRALFRADVSKDGTIVPGRLRVKTFKRKNNKYERWTVSFIFIIVVPFFFIQIFHC